jgi:hypothetical protein
MFVLKDKTKKSRDELTQVNFIEFLEFLGRIADIAFKNQVEYVGPEHYLERLRMVFDSVLAIVGLDRIEDTAQVDEESFSDDDY